jgi:hypothetical protein
MAQLQGAMMALKSLTDSTGRFGKSAATAQV